MYLLSAIRYPLNMTQFSFNQCEELNKVINNSILPKSGLNRKTPRALVYAPLSVGGCNFEHMWTVQLDLNLQAFQKHLRHMDAVGHVILGKADSWE